MCTGLLSTGPRVITTYFHVPFDILLDFIVKFHFSILGYTDNYNNYASNVLLWPDNATLSVARCFFASCQCSVPANLSLIFFSTFWCVSIIHSYGLKLFPSVSQQDFLMSLISCITTPSFLIQLLLKVVQPVVIHCLVAPSDSHPLHRVMDYIIQLLREAFRGLICYCDDKRISNLAIVLMYQPDLCLERLRKTTTAVIFGHQSHTISKY